MQHEYGYEYNNLHTAKDDEIPKLVGDNYVNGYFYIYNKDKTVSIYNCMNSEATLVRTLSHAIDKDMARIQVGVYARHNPVSGGEDRMNSYLLTMYPRKNEFHSFVTARSTRKGVIYSPKEVDELHHIFTDFYDDFEYII